MIAPPIYPNHPYVIIDNIDIGVIIMKKQLVSIFAILALSCSTAQAVNGEVLREAGKELLELVTPRVIAVGASVCGVAGLFYALDACLHHRNALYYRNEYVSESNSEYVMERKEVTKRDVATLRAGILLILAGGIALLQQQA